MGYYEDCIGKTTKERLKKHKEKGCTSYNELVNKMLDYYEKNKGIPTTDLRQILTAWEVGKYSMLYHDYQTANQVVSETPVQFRESLDMDQIEKQRTDYFKFKEELEKKYGVEIKGDI